MNLLIVLPIFLPIICGALLLVLPERLLPKADRARMQVLTIYTCVVLVLGTAAVLADVFLLDEQAQTLKLLQVTEGVTLYFSVDRLGGFFALLVSGIWILAGIFSYDYMMREEHQKRYFAFYILSYGVLIGLDFAGNLVTMYLFYELMTILSMPLVLHEQSGEAIMAGLKYLMYSFCGAYLALFGLFFLNRYCTSLTFTPGGTLNMEAVQGHEGLLLLVVFCMILGFGVKAGMFPMHAWLPTAHPVAPSPASAVLSGIIVKSGVLAIIRVVYELVGVSFVAGTWVQHAWLILSLITVFMGSLLAYREPVLKKRLAYSTVSQLSYILFGLALFNQTAATGALLHVIVHAVIKTALFLCAGALIMQTGKKEVSAFRGIGKTMPVTLWCYTFVSLGLIGIPPFSGLVSKWYLATGALEGGMAVYSWLGPVVLLVSALLTAGYLLPVTIDGFLPGADYEETKKRHEPILMVLPLVILAALTLGFGLFPNPLIRFLSGIVSGWF